MAVRIEFEQRERELFESESVEFPAAVDGRPVACAVTQDALRKLSRGASGSLAAFLAHRPAVEAAARRLIEAGRVREGALVITEADV